jgi:DNA-binding CsgD family transcriptional regulator
VARAEGDRWNESLSLLNKGVVQMRRGRLREAEEPLREGVAVMRDLDQLWGAALGQVLLGTAARTRGDLAGARRLFEEALPALREIDARPMIIRCRKGLGRCALAQGDLAEARRVFGESLRLGVSIGLRIAVARCLEAFAELLAQEGDERGTLLLAAAAAALRDEIGAPPARSRVCATGLQGVLEQARRRLGEHRVAQLWGEGRAMSVDDAVAYAPYGPPGGAVPAAGAAGRAPALGGDADPGRAPGGASPGADGGVRAGAAARDPGARGCAPVAGAERAVPARVPAAPMTPPGMLTPREREIAQMIARGLSNRGIADELVISPATVARHVTNILTKLGFGSRAQVAAWAVDNIAVGE